MPGLPWTGRPTSRSPSISPAEFLTRGLRTAWPRRSTWSACAQDRLELEITESVLLERTTNNLDTLNTLNVLGVQISLDDFAPSIRR